MPKPKDIDAYIAAAPSEQRRMLKQLRSAIRAAVPKAEGKLSYGMPYYSYHGRLAYFAAFKNHVSLFVWGRVMKKFAAQVKRYATSKATLQFPNGTPIPITLVKKLVKARAALNEAEARDKKR